MSLLRQITRLFDEPPPEFAFEISAEGIAWARTNQPAALQWAPLPADVLSVTPVKDNVLRADVFAEFIDRLAPRNGNRKVRRAALVLPDYCARVSVIDFDTFPTDTQEQLALLRFRMKRMVPFDVDTAIINFHAQPRGGVSKKTDVLVAAVAAEVAGPYEQPFRNAGYYPGFVTLSALSALSLDDEPGAGPTSGPSVFVKLSGRALAVAVLSGGKVRLFRSVELPDASAEEVLDVLFPTFAFVEDELGERPGLVRLCGFPRLDQTERQRWSDAFGIPVSMVRSRFGVPSAGNSGLLGYLEMQEVA